jgi:hypothetical protein
MFLIASQRPPPEPDSMASDVASQGGSGSASAGSLSGEGRMAWGAEPRDRERSSGRGQEAPGSRAVAPAAQGQGIAHPRIIWEFHGRISGSSAAGQSSGRAASAGGESPKRIGQSRAATRPQPAKLRQVYQTWPGATRIPERSGARSNRSSFGHSRQTGPMRPSGSLCLIEELRARAPPGVLTCADPFGAR